MVSTLKVQTIQIPNSDSDIITFDTSGNVTLNANKTSSGFGVSTATSTLPSEGGAATTNVVQGLTKSWIRFNGSSTIAINDSFNCSTIADNGTGDYTMTMQSAMNNVNYAQTCGAGDVDHGAKINIAFTDANTTTTMRVRLAAAVSGNGDSSIVTNQVSGDLA